MANTDASNALMGAGGGLSRAQLIARVIAIGVPVAGAVPTGINLYQSWKHGIPYSEVSHRLHQYDLWVKNAHCKIDYKELNASKGAKIQVGACSTTGDISIKIALATGQAKFEWLAFDQLQRATTSSLLDAFVGSAHAMALPGDPSRPAFHRTQVPGAQVKCMDTLQGKAVRVVEEAGKCYRETINPIQGKLEKREEVDCAKACPLPKS